MTPVGDYLKKLLYQYDCLVVPEFGAFLTHYLPASFSEATGQYLPPRKRLAFNEALRLDDGILINYVMLHESMTRDEALRFINGFVTAMKQQIRAGGSYTIDGVGLLTTNGESKLQFHPELRHNFEAESYGFQPIQAQYCASKEVSLPVVVLPVAPNVLPVLADAGADEGQLMPLPVRRPVWQWVAAALLVGTLGVYSYFSVLQPGDLLQSSLSPASLLRMPAFMMASTPVSVKAPEPKPVVPPATTPVPVLAPVVVESKPIIMPKIETAVKKAAPVTLVAVVVAKPVRLAAARKGALSAPKRIVAKPFLIVAGSFSSRQNALGLRRQLRKAGYDDAYLMAPKHPRELIKVAAFGATTLAEADSVMVNVRELTGVPAWLMRTR